MTGNVFRWVLASSIALLGFSGRGLAQDGYAGAWENTADYFMDMTLDNNSLRLGQELLKSSQQTTGSGTSRPSQSSPAAKVSLQVPMTKQSVIPAKLSARYPVAVRSQMKTTFSNLLAFYPQAEKNVGLPSNDAATALTIFIVASMEAYQNRDIPKQFYQPLYRQLSPALSQNAAFAKINLSAKQEFRDQLAVLALLLASIRIEMKKPANQAQAKATQAATQQAGKAYLEGMLGLQAERLNLTERGLVFK